MFRSTTLSLFLNATFAVAQPDPIENLVRDIFASKCASAGCHTGSRPAALLSLEEENFANNTVNVVSREVPQLQLIMPGNAVQSYLIRKVKGQGIRGERMPKDSATLSAGEAAVLEQWVSSMPSNAPPPLPQRKHVQNFYGWTLGDLPTAETLERGAFLYRISHRFQGTIGSGFGNLFGIDGGALMLTQLAFPVSHKLTLGVARNKINTTFEIGAKLRFLRQRQDGRMPISAALYAGISWATIKGLPDPANAGATLRPFSPQRFAYFVQVPVSRSLSKRVSALVALGMLFNGNFAQANERMLSTLGLGAKYSFNQKYALFAQLVPILGGDATAATVNGQRLQGNSLVFSDTFTSGFEIKSGGHVFHVFVTNSAGNTTDQYLSGADLAGGSLRLGFNIYRVLNYPSF